jgi:non-specific serine/threonine protein kinase
MIEESGMQSARMKILEGLLRLRQISNHPALIEKTYKGESAKMEVLLDELETLRAEGHKALVFSQFTQMLKALKTEMDARKFPYLYLDGHTTDRQERVDAFQSNPDIPFFLISLKAGGVGLNLTAADYVIHIDPWWNPAVERQASDRTHRIGQEKPVFVNKLIARGTVEEKILELQERKRDLVDRLITAESGFFKSLTADDVSELFG